MHMTSKELNYLTDSLKNEDTLARLCLHHAAASQNQELGRLFAQMAESRLGHYRQLLGQLQGQTSATH